LQAASTHHRLRLFALACALIAGCSSSHTHTPTPLELEPCLAQGPVNSQGYDNCLADRAALLRELLKSLNEPGSLRYLEVQPAGTPTFQLSDYPDTPTPMTYRGADSLTATERREQPFKIKVTWKYLSKRFGPEPRDRVPMEDMESLLLAAAKENGLAKWACTVTGGKQRQWIFYTRDDAVFIARIKSVLAPTGPYPIEFSARRESGLGTDVDTAQDSRLTPKKCME
jgi:hypothetical protein